MTERGTHDAETYEDSQLQSAVSDRARSTCVHLQCGRTEHNRAQSEPGCISKRAYVTFSITMQGIRPNT